MTRCGALRCVASLGGAEEAAGSVSFASRLSGTRRAPVGRSGEPADPFVRLSDMGYRQLSAVLTLAAGLLYVGCRAQVETEIPDWYAERRKLPSCGAIDPYTAEYPNRTASGCFRAAYEDGTPSELTTLSYGDEGESFNAHFRVLGPGRYEIVGESRSALSGSSSDRRIDGWERYSCGYFVFLDDPGAELQGTPGLNIEGECELVERSPS